MKWIAILLSGLLAITVLFFVLLFTPPGNALLAPLIEKKLQTILAVPLTLERFRLGYNHFETDIALSANNHIEAAGSFSLFSQSVAAQYRVRLDDLSRLKALTKQPLQGAFHTDGNVSGPFKALHVAGRSNVARSVTTYQVEIVNYDPKSVTLSLKNADIGDLLFITMQPAFAEGALSVNADIAPLIPAQARGELRIGVSDGHFDAAVMKNRFNVTLPKTRFTFDTHAKFNPKNADYTLVFASGLAQINSKGMLSPESLSADLTYDIDVKELALLAPLTHQPFRGPLALHGTLKGDKNRMRIVAASDIAGSDTHLDAQFKMFKPLSASLDIKHLKLKKLLYVLGQPLYADADVDLSASLPNLEPGQLDGKINLDLTHGHADRTVVANAFEWPDFKGTDFAVKSQTTLKGNLAASGINITSDLMTLHAAPMRYDLGSRILTSDYTTSVPDLSRLNFLSKHALRGTATVTGNLRFDKTLTLNAESKIAGGRVKATLKDKTLHADLTALKTLQALYILTYPEIFDAILDGTMDYDLGIKKGVFKATLTQGRFTKNGAFDLLRQYTPLNLYQERFDGNTSAAINDKRIDADLLLRSNRSSLSSRHAAIDTEKNTIDAKIHLDANHNPVDFRLQGAINHPKVSVDAGKLIEREAGKQINRLLNNLFK